MKKKENNPWDIQENETVKSYVWFNEYLKLGHERSLSKLAKLRQSETLQHIKHWCSKFKWVDRAAAWDIAKIKYEHEMMIHEHIEEARAARTVLNAPVDEIRKRIALGKINFDKLTTPQLYNLATKSISLLRPVAELERLSKGEPTEIQESTDRTIIIEGVGPLNNEPVENND